MLTASHGNNYAKNLALFGALCLFLSAAEYMIPKPLPFMRVGLSNLPVMLACDIFPLRAFLVLICVKILGQALITGTLFSYIFLFSMAGTLLSALLMFILRRALKNRISFTGIGTAGALISNISQLTLAYYFIFGENIRFITPVFLTAGLLTGIALGVFCEIFAGRSSWYKNIKSGHESAEKNIINYEKIKVSFYPAKSADKREQAVLKGWRKRALDFYDSISAKDMFIAGFFMLSAVIFNPSTKYRVIQFLFFLLLVFLSGKRVNLFITFFVTIFIIVFNLLIPYGQVLFSAGIFKITKGALEAGVHRAFTLQALIMLSKLTIKKDLKLPGTFGILLSESLVIFSALMSEKPRLNKGNIIKNIDNIIKNLDHEEINLSRSQEIRTKPYGFIILIIALLLSWLPWLFL